jgi:hypothetical protein
MSYTQFYCPRDQGMILRSGRVINCIENTKFYEDLYEFENGYAGYTDEYAFHCIPCKEVFVLLDFMEKYYDILRSEKHLSKIYYSIPKRISTLIAKLGDQNKCTCHLNTRSRWALFLDEFYDLDQLRSEDEQRIGSIMENYGGYEDRKTYRLYNRNFLCMRPRPDLHIFIDSPFHDFEMVIRELIHWNRYFDRHNIPDLKKIKSILSYRTINDCAGIIAGFL